MDYFKHQDAFMAEMVSAFNDGKLSAVYAPYFQWKQDGKLFNRQQGYEMMTVSENELGELYDDPNADTAIVSYLEAINGEISNVIGILL